MQKREQTWFRNNEKNLSARETLRIIRQFEFVYPTEILQQLPNINQMLLAAISANDFLSIFRQ